MELPIDFFEAQFRNWDYKLENGESTNEVSIRMNNAIKDIINNNRNKNIVIVSHGTVISTMIKNWCNKRLNEDTKLIEIYYDNKMIFDVN